MRRTYGIAIAIIFGLLSIVLLYVFYSHQNQFSHHYKQVLSQFHTLDSIETKLTYNIMQNTLYLYNNQDSISQNRNTLAATLTNIQNDSLLQDKNYQSILNQIRKLEAKTELYYYQIDSFLTLNAGIKNSFIYINTHAYEAIIKEKHDPEYIRMSQYISKAFVTAGRTLDPDLLLKTKKDIQNLYSYNQSLKKPSRAIGLFLLHVRFISENFPAYIETLNYLLSNPLLADITTLQENFTQTASKDIAALDRFALLLLMLFVSAIVFISVLLIRIRRENHKLEKTQQELKNALVYDQLTGLKNRFSFQNDLLDYKQPTLILFNIDNFKHVNDFYGTEIGNYVLKKCADILKDVTINHYDDQIYRLGGDDFGVIFQNASHDAIEHNAQTMLRAINTHTFNINNLEINITVSAAISNESPLIENADMALKHIKGISNVSLITYEDALGLKEAVSNNIEITNTLKQAIASDRIVPYFQPIFNLKHNCIEKYEALVRIECIDGLTLQPWQFLPVAQKTTYYADITRIMLQKSMHYFKELPYRFSVNIAMQDLLNEELMGIIKETLKSDRETAKRVDFELLENEHIDDIALVNGFINEIKAYGCRVSIDDFGSGYSNFSYLLQLDIDILKIDGSLIKEINHDPKSYQIVKTIVNFAQINDLEVVAEFVENHDIAECLSELDVTYGQGYYYGKPLSNTL
jgi:diguanylate cyclase (GGDEF)-like protein